MGDDATTCNVAEPRRRHRLLQWRRGLGLGLGRRRKLPVVRLGGSGGSRGGRRARGNILRRLRLRWLRRAVCKLAAIYMAALAGPPHGASASSFPPWIGVEACFATAFVPTGRPFW